VYWGEYPLSFAACLSQEECYRLILARGADPDGQDTNGNTVLHMLVIYRNQVRTESDLPSTCTCPVITSIQILFLRARWSSTSSITFEAPPKPRLYNLPSLLQGTFDMAYEVGASLSVRNVLNLTPLTLAAKLARRDMFFHILNIEREIYWQIGKSRSASIIGQ